MKEKVKSPYRCPKCNKPGRYRRGVGFDHEMRCWSCDETWEPEQIIQELQEKTEELRFVSGDGI